MAPIKPPSDLTDTGKQRAIDDAVEQAEEAAAEAKRAAASARAASPTPTPVAFPRSSDSAEMAKRALDWLECETKGPASKLSKRMDAVEEEIKVMKLNKATEDGKNQEIAKEAARSTSMRTVVIAGGFSLAAVALGFVLNRAFLPAQAQAAPMQAMVEELRALKAEIRTAGARSTP